MARWSVFRKRGKSKQLSVKEIAERMRPVKESTLSLPRSFARDLSAILRRGRAEKVSSIPYGLIKTDLPAYEITWYCMGCEELKVLVTELANTLETLYTEQDGPPSLKPARVEAWTAAMNTVPLLLKRVKEAKS